MGEFSQVPSPKMPRCHINPVFPPRAAVHLPAQGARGPGSVPGCAYPLGGYGTGPTVGRMPLFAPRNKDWGSQSRVQSDYHLVHHAKYYRCWMELGEREQNSWQAEVKPVVPREEDADDGVYPAPCERQR